MARIATTLEVLAYVSVEVEVEDPDDEAAARAAAVEAAQSKADEVESAVSGLGFGSFDARAGRMEWAVIDRAATEGGEQDGQ